MSGDLAGYFRPRPAARYIHPKALDSPAQAGEHDADLDVTDERASNYLSWITELVAPHLGQSVLELGAGIGSITERYAGGRTVLATDLSDRCVSALTGRFAGSRNVTVAQKDLRQLADEADRFDSIVMINVLEHIEDDAGVLATMKPVLAPGGRIVLYVPALNGLYGPWDRKVGHFRRYSKWRLRGVAREAGLTIAQLRYVNALAIPAWLAFSRTDVEQTNGASLSVWDRTGVPLTRALERRVRVPLGLNVLAVLVDQTAEDRIGRR